MPIDGFDFTEIPNSDVDPDSPVDTTLMTSLRDNDSFFMRWMGKDGVENAKKNHAHLGLDVDGDGTSKVPGASGGVQIATIDITMPANVGGSIGGQGFTHINFLADLAFAWNLGNGGGTSAQANGAFKQTIDTSFHSGLTSQNMFGGTYLNTQGIQLVRHGGLFFSSAANFYTSGNRAEAWFLKRREDMINMEVYIGDGTNDRVISGLDFDPEFVWVFPIEDESNGTPVMRSRNFISGVSGVGESRSTGIAGALETNAILDFGTNSFTLGSDEQVNEDGDGYLFIALPQEASFDGESVFVTSYIGDGVDDREITGSDFDDELLFTPDLVIVIRTTGNNEIPQIYTRAMGLHSMGADGNIMRANLIQGIVPRGIQLGTNSTVNASGIRYDIIFFKGGTFRA